MQFKDLISTDFSFVKAENDLETLTQVRSSSTHYSAIKAEKLGESIVFKILLTGL